MGVCISLVIDLWVDHTRLAGFSLSYVWLKLVDGSGILSVLYNRIVVLDSVFGLCLWTLPEITNIKKCASIRNFVENSWLFG
jgi:hypothetical protein